MAPLFPTRKQLHETEHSYHALTHHFPPPTETLKSGLGETRIPIGDMSNRRREGNTHSL